MLSMEQAPLPPHFAFTGEVKRADWYNCVSPGMVERAVIKQTLGAGMAQSVQRRRWISALPTKVGDDPAALPDPDGGAGVVEDLPEAVVSASVQYVRRPSQLLAVRRIRQAPSNQVVLSTAIELCAAAEAEGRRVLKSEGRPVVVQLSDDLKYGFNERKELAMAVWLSVPDSLRGEYVAVVIEE
jgi:hypothetical protein